MTIDKDELKKLLKEHLTVTVGADKGVDRRQVEIKVVIKFDGEVIDQDKDYFWQ